MNDPLAGKFTFSSMIDQSLKNDPVSLRANLILNWKLSMFSPVAISLLPKVHDDALLMSSHVIVAAALAGVAANAVPKAAADIKKFLIDM